MLQVSYIRENRDKVLERLAVKNFKQPALVDEIIQLDERRRLTQNKLDGVSSQANAAAKQVGELMRSGKKEERQNRCRQDRRLLALRFPARVPHGID